MKLAFPCMKFKNVGVKQVGNGKESIFSFQAVKQAQPSLADDEQWKQGVQQGAQCNESPAVFITSDGTGCWSRVGMVDLGQNYGQTTQGLNLQHPCCTSLGTALHELGHVFGMDHEQSRPDRNTYVKVHTDRISADGQEQFGVNQKGASHARMPLIHRFLSTADVAGDHCLLQSYSWLSPAAASHPLPVTHTLTHNVYHLYLL